MFFSGIAKVNPILVMVLRNTNHVFLVPLSVMDLKPLYLVIALRSANTIFGLIKLTWGREERWIGICVPSRVFDD
jgi:hypothetical protein